LLDGFLSSLVLGPISGRGFVTAQVPLRIAQRSDGEVMRSRPNPLLEQHFWQQGISPIAGVDEAGVGAWAGPVIAAAVLCQEDAKASRRMRDEGGPFGAAV
jgi:hypothetical protein